MNFSSQRLFQLWDANVSHQQLLIRSAANVNDCGNIDIVFWGVKFVVLPTELRGIALDDSASMGDSSLHSQYGPLSGTKVFKISSASKEYYVVAAGAKVLANSMNIFESSLVDFSNDRAKAEYGTVLAHS